MPLVYWRRGEHANARRKTHFEEGIQVRVVEYRFPFRSDHEIPSVSIYYFHPLTLSKRLRSSVGASLKSMERNEEEGDERIR